LRKHLDADGNDLLRENSSPHHAENEHASEQRKDTDGDDPPHEPHKQPAQTFLVTALARSPRRHPIDGPRYRPTTTVPFEPRPTRERPAQHRTHPVTRPSTELRSGG
jgi:hypothetical protein